MINAKWRYRAVNIATRYRRKTLLIGVCSAMVGCGGGAAVQVEGDFPKPLIVASPVHVGLVLDDALITYVHTETIEKAGEWSVDVGPMQPKLFRSVFGAMFTDVTEVATIADGAGLAGVLVPRIDKFQIAVPAQTRNDFYEVWIRYVIALYDAGGSPIVEWPLTAYGKTSKEEFGPLESADEPGMRAATMTAMRDAGAFLALRFPTLPEVQRWLRAHASPDAEGMSP